MSAHKERILIWITILVSIIGETAARTLHDDDDVFDDVTVPRFCLTDPEPDDVTCLHESRDAWFYSATYAMCVRFVDSGCVQRKNSFNTEQQCINTCAPGLIHEDDDTPSFVPLLSTIPPLMFGGGVAGKSSPLVEKVQIKPLGDDVTFSKSIENNENINNPSDGNVVETLKRIVGKEMGEEMIKEGPVKPGIEVLGSVTRSPSMMHGKMAGASLLREEPRSDIMDNNNEIVDNNSNNNNNNFDNNFIINNSDNLNRNYPGNQDMHNNFNNDNSNNENDNLEISSSKKNINNNNNNNNEDTKMTAPLRLDRVNIDKISDKVSSVTAAPLLPVIKSTSQLDAYLQHYVEDVDESGSTVTPSSLITEARISEAEGTTVKRPATPLANFESNPKFSVDDQGAYFEDGIMGKEFVDKTMKEAPTGREIEIKSDNKLAIQQQEIKDLVRNEGHEFIVNKEKKIDTNALNNENLSPEISPERKVFNKYEYNDDIISIPSDELNDKSEELDRRPLSNMDSESDDDNDFLDEVLPDESVRSMLEIERKDKAESRLKPESESSGNKKNENIKKDEENVKTSNQNTSNDPNPQQAGSQNVESVTKEGEQDRLEKITETSEDFKKMTDPITTSGLSTLSTTSPNMMHKKGEGSFKESKSGQESDLDQSTGNQDKDSDDIKDNLVKIVRERLNVFHPLPSVPFEAPIWSNVEEPRPPMSPVTPSDAKQTLEKKTGERIKNKKSRKEKLKMEKLSKTGVSQFSPLVRPEEGPRMILVPPAILISRAEPRVGMGLPFNLHGKGSQRLPEFREESRRNVFKEGEEGNDQISYENDDVHRDFNSINKPNFYRRTQERITIQRIPFPFMNDNQFKFPAPRNIAPQAVIVPKDPVKNARKNSGVTTASNSLIGPKEAQPGAKPVVSLYLTAKYKPSDFFSMINMMGKPNTNPSRESFKSGIEESFPNTRENIGFSNYPRTNLNEFKSFERPPQPRISFAPIRLQINPRIFGVMRGQPMNQPASSGYFGSSFQNPGGEFNSNQQYNKGGYWSQHNDRPLFNPHMENFNDAPQRYPSGSYKPFYEGPSDNFNSGFESNQRKSRPYLGDRFEENPSHDPNYRVNSDYEVNPESPNQFKSNSDIEGKEAGPSNQGISEAQGADHESEFESQKSTRNRPPRTKLEISPHNQFTLMQIFVDKEDLNSIRRRNRDGPSGKMYTERFEGRDGPPSGSQGPMLPPLGGGEGDGDASVEHENNLKDFDLERDSTERLSRQDSEDRHDESFNPHFSFCYQPLHLGNCKSIEIRWYYNAYLGRCEMFQYGGCGGNENRFNSYETCVKSCITGTVTPVFTDSVRPSTASFTAILPSEDKDKAAVEPLDSNTATITSASSSAEPTTRGADAEKKVQNDSVKEAKSQPESGEETALVEAEGIPMQYIILAAVLGFVTLTIILIGVCGLVQLCKKRRKKEISVEARHEIPSIYGVTNIMYPESEISLDKGSGSVKISNVEKQETQD